MQIGMGSPLGAIYHVFLSVLSVLCHNFEKVGNHCFNPYFERELTLWEPAYDIFVLRFRPKKQQFSVALPTP